MTRLELDAYLRRIEYTGDLRPSYDVLASLHFAHATHIPFENLDILLGRRIQLDLSSIHAKLVGGNRGGYCFEHNLLFASVLEQIGFTVTPLAARVRHGTTLVLPRTHMALLVDLEGTRWLVDVGFGGEGLLYPVSLTARETRQFAWVYRIVEEDGRRLFQSQRAGVWHDLYAFTLEPQHRADYEMANHYTSTHPSSRFVQTLTVQLPGPDARTILRNRELTVETSAASTTTIVEDDDELLEVLAHRFGLLFPPGTRFPVLAAVS